jgi:hypothetical protein
MSVLTESFPSFGFFGVGPRLSIRCGVGETVLALRLSLDAPYPEVLNLDSVVLKGEEPEENLLPRISVCEASSNLLGAAHEPADLLVGRGFHSELTVAPWWEVRFLRPTYVAGITIENRSDHYGFRSRTLRVSYLTSSGHWRNSWAASAWDEMCAVADSLSLLLGDCASRVTTAGSLTRREMLACLATKLLDPDSDRVVDWRRTLALVNLWSEAPMSASEMRIASLFALDAPLTSARELSFLSGVVSSRTELVRLANSVTATALLLGRPGVSLTRHGVGEVISYSAAALEATIVLMRQVIDWLEVHEMEPLICYGTLLGALRSGSVIAGDDDVDVLCRVSASSYEHAELAVEHLSERLAKAGFGVTPIEGSLNIHVDDGHGAYIDLFPFWVQGESAYLHMSYMTIDTVPLQVLLPRGQVHLNGDSWPAPALPEAFLTTRYGSTWRDADPYFEWPWPLSPDQP